MTSWAALALQYQYAYTSDGNGTSRGHKLCAIRLHGDLGITSPGRLEPALEPDGASGLVLVNYDAQSDAVTNADHPFQEHSRLSRGTS